MAHYTNMTFALEIVALVSGTALLILSGKEGVCCKGFAKTIASIAIIGSALAIICTVSTAIKHWGKGHDRPYHHSMNYMMEMDQMNEGTSKPALPPE